jgi:hypothetical protein
MEMTADRFREEAVRRRGGRRRGAAPYSAEQKAFAAGYARTGLAEGRSLMASAIALGVSDPTLRDWMERGPTGSSTPLRRVVVAPRAEPSSSSGLTLITPAGYRIRGLDVGSAAALLRVLG